jgi:xanthine dehydrogenase accessory factor
VVSAVGALNIVLVADSELADMVDFFERVAVLQREGQSFAVATVVARRAPVSAHLGDRAIVFADGRIEGFVGGACSHEIIRQQALEAMQARHGRLVSIRPDASESAESTPEHAFVPMTCVSEGAVDVYIEPVVHARRLVVVGVTPVAESLARLARSMAYDVVRVVEARELRDIEQESASLGVTVVTLDLLESTLRAGASDQAAVVASQGHYDEQALEVILGIGVPYVGLVASRKRGSSVRAALEAGAVPGLAALRSPAGLDLGARSPSEVALSILAEIVQAQPSGTPLPAAVAASPPPAASAIDPVCGMQVDVATAIHMADVDGVVYYFCCQNCRARFIKQPQDYPGNNP